MSDLSIALNLYYLLQSKILLVLALEFLQDKESGYRTINFTFFHLFSYSPLTLLALTYRNLPCQKYFQTIWAYFRRLIVCIVLFWSDNTCWPSCLIQCWVQKQYLARLIRIWSFSWALLTFKNVNKKVLLCRIPIENQLWKEYF